MADKSGQTFTLPQKSSLVAELFTTQQQRDEDKREKVQNIALTEIDPFTDHPFQVKLDESMQAMTESVKAFGVHTPAVVRPTEDGRFELVSGHRRKMACELAGLETMPCIVRQLSRDEAIVAMVDANLQRATVLPSEKAKSYKMKLDAMKRQAGRPSNNYVPVGHNFAGKPARELLAENSPDSNSQIQRYIRLTNLIPPLIQMVDEGKIAFRPAVELSYISEVQQESLHETILSEDCTPSLAQAIKMKQFSQENRLNEDVILSILSETKPNQREKISFQADTLRKYIPKSIPINKTEDYVIQALEHYQRFRERQRTQER